MKIQNGKSKIITSIVVILLSVTVMGTNLPAVHATSDESYEGVESGQTDTQGVLSSLTVESTQVSPSGFSNHRDYMSYINTASCGTCSVDTSVGGGWYIDTTGSPYDLTYANQQGGYVVHNTYTALTAGNSFTGEVLLVNNTSTQECWKSYTASTNQDYCVASVTGATASNVGVVARTFSAYSSSNDLPGLFDENQDIYYNGALGEEYFSQATNGYKCWSNTAAGQSNSYVLEYLANESGNNGAKIDKVGTGPSTYTTDDCGGSYVSQVWDAKGESGGAGSNS